MGWVWSLVDGNQHSPQNLENGQCYCQVQGQSMYQLVTPDSKAWVTQKSHPVILAISQIANGFTEAHSLIDMLCNAGIIFTKQVIRELMSNFQILWFL